MSGERPEEVMTAVAERELQWLENFGEPRSPRIWGYRDIHDNQKMDPKVQMSSLKDYLKLAPYILPDDQTLSRPTIRHPDLSPNNIFVSHTGEITSIIDWQHATVMPLFLQSKMPKHFENYGDEDSEKYRRPELPKNFETLTAKEKEIESDRYRRRQLHYIYLGATRCYNYSHWRGLAFDKFALRNQLYEAAGSPWEGDNTTLRARLMRTTAAWSALASGKSIEQCPVSYAEEDVKQCMDLEAKEKKVDDAMVIMRKFFGCTADGHVSHEDYEDAKAKIAMLKKTAMEDADTEEERRDIDENWPFQDHEEIE